jgi:hypothetical protein
MDSGALGGDPITFSTIVGGMAFAIVTMAKVFHGWVKKLSLKLDDCEEKHSEATKEHIEIRSELSFMKGCMAGHEQAREDLKLTGEAIEWMHQTVKRKNDETVDHPRQSA